MAIRFSCKGTWLARGGSVKSRGNVEVRKKLNKDDIIDNFLGVEFKLEIQTIWITFRFGIALGKSTTNHIFIRFLGKSTFSPTQKKKLTSMMLVQLIIRRRGIFIYFCSAQLISF